MGGGGGLSAARCVIVRDKIHAVERGRLSSRSLNFPPPAAAFAQLSRQPSFCFATGSLGVQVQAALVSNFNRARERVRNEINLSGLVQIFNDAATYQDGKFIISPFNRQLKAGSLNFIVDGLTRYNWKN